MLNCLLTALSSLLLGLLCCLLGLLLLFSGLLLGFLFIGMSLLFSCAPLRVGITVLIGRGWVFDAQRNAQELHNPGEELP